MFHFAAKCALKPDTGPCDQKIQRWYFNAKKKKCEEFLYGGCKGNLNRFITEDTCVTTCLLKGIWYCLILDFATDPCSFMFSLSLWCQVSLNYAWDAWDYVLYFVCTLWDCFSDVILCRDIWFQTANSGWRWVLWKKNNGNASLIL